MLSDRAQALLQASATIYVGYVVAGDKGSPAARAEWATDEAYALLALIEAREPRAVSREVKYCRCEEVDGDTPGCPIHGG